MDEYSRVQEAGDAAFRKCFAERVKNEKYFASLVKQAQGLVDRVKSLTPLSRASSTALIEMRDHGAVRSRNAA